MDLNCDLGEGYDDWEPGVGGLDQRLLGIVTSANVACGGHAGDDRVMAAVCATAAARGVAVGAHVSYEDRAGFGRTFVDVPAAVLRGQVAAQVLRLARHAGAAGTAVAYVKPHGALYHALVHHEAHARAVLDGIVDAERELARDGLPVVGLPGAAVLKANGYAPPLSPVIGWTGVATTLLAPFGGYALNLAAITAAICSNAGVHPDPARRWPAAVAAGVFYLLVGLLGAGVALLFAALPRELIMAIAGLALLGTIGQGLAVATRDERWREPALITYLVSLSGITVGGIGAAFWGLVAGIVAAIALEASDSRR